MWSTFKSMPLLPKIVIICLVLGFVYKVSALNGNHTSNSIHYTPVSDQGRRGQASNDESSNDEPRNTAARNTGRQEADENQPDANNGQLAQLQSEQSQLMARVQQCEAQMTQATNQQAMAAMNGQMYNQRPQCEGYMPQWISQEAFLEAQIARTQNPNDHRSLREITGIAPPSYSAPSGGRSSTNDGGLAAVDKWNRVANRGNSMYTDESGEQHELATQNHYYRDRSSGEIIGSDQPNPPNNGRDYEQFSNTDQPE